MISPRVMAMLAKDQMKKEGKEVSKLPEPKFGWGHEGWVEDLADTISKMDFPYMWTSKEVTDYIAKFIRSCGHANASSVSHERDGRARD